MAVLTGFGGHISRGTVGGGGEAHIGCVRQWGISEVASAVEARCSASKRGTIRAAGNKDWTGQYQAYGGTPEVLPGELFEFEGAITGDGAAAIGAKGNSICDNVSIEWNYETGAIISHTVAFGANGALTKGTVTCPEDDTIPDPKPATGCKIERAVDPFTSFTEIAGVRTAKLTLSKSNKAYVVSDSAGITKRSAGPFDAQVEMAILADAATGFNIYPALNTVLALRLYIDSTTFWLLKWMQVLGISGENVDIEGGDLVGGSLSFGMCGITKVSTVPTVGAIITPAVVTIWP